MAGFKKSDGSYIIEKRDDGKTYLNVPPSGKVFVTGGAFASNGAYNTFDGSVFGSLGEQVPNYRFKFSVPAVMGQTTGYIVGGRYGYTNPYTASDHHPSFQPTYYGAGVKEVSSFPFTTSGSTTDVGDLVNYASSTVGINASHKGYGFVGTTTYSRIDDTVGPIASANTSAIPSNGFPVKSFDKIAFAAPVTVTDVGDLSGAFSFRGAAGHTSGTKGYVSGGAVTDDDYVINGIGLAPPFSAEPYFYTLYPYPIWSGAIPGSPGAARFATSKTQSFPLASMPGGVATDVVELYDTTYTGARGFSSTDHGYVMGSSVNFITDDNSNPSYPGYNQGPRLGPYDQYYYYANVYDSYKKFPFSVEQATSTSVGDYVMNKLRYQAVSAKFRGYSIGRTYEPFGVIYGAFASLTGWLPPYSIPAPPTAPLLRNESFSFTTDSNSTGIGTLTWPTPVSAMAVFTGGTGVAATNDRGYITGGTASASMGGPPANRATIGYGWYDRAQEFTHVTSFPFSIDSGDVAADVWDASPSPVLVRHNSTLAV